MSTWFLLWVPPMHNRTTSPLSFIFKRSINENDEEQTEGGGEESLKRGLAFGGADPWSLNTSNLKVGSYFLVNIFFREIILRAFAWSLVMLKLRWNQFYSFGRASCRSWLLIILRHPRERVYAWTNKHKNMVLRVTRQLVSYLHPKIFICQELQLGNNRKIFEDRHCPRESDLKKNPFTVNFASKLQRFGHTHTHN